MMGVRVANSGLSRRSVVNRITLIGRLERATNSPDQANLS